MLIAAIYAAGLAVTFLNLILHVKKMF